MKRLYSPPNWTSIFFTIFSLLFFPGMSSEQALIDKDYALGAGYYLEEFADNTIGIIAKPSLTATDAFYLHLDANGNQILSGTLATTLSRIIPIAREGFVAAGQNQGNIRVRKSNRLDETVWDKEYGPGIAKDVYALRDGNLLVTGVFYTPDSILYSNYVVQVQKPNTFLLKLDANGNPIFLKKYTSNSIQENAAGTKIVELSNGNLALTAISTIFSSPYSGSYTSLVYIIDPDGNILEAKGFPVSVYFVGGINHTDLKPTADGGFLIAATNGFYCKWCVPSAASILKMSPAGDVLWSHRQSPGFSYPQHLVSAVDERFGQIYAIGNTAPEIGYATGDPSDIFFYSENDGLSCKYDLGTNISFYNYPGYARTAKNGDILVTGRRGDSVFFMRLPADFCTPTDNLVDLELNWSSPNPNPLIYRNFTSTLQLTNKGPLAATNITVKAPLPPGVVYQGGNEATTIQGSFTPYGVDEWRIPLLEPGRTAVLHLNYFLVSIQNRTVLAQVTECSERDADSQPANGTCCQAREDDEAALLVNGDLGTPDIALANLRSAGSGRPGDVVSYQFDLLNLGTASAVPDYLIGAYLSLDGSVSSDDYRVGEIPTGNTPVGTIADVPGSIRLPAQIPAGFYFLILDADENNQVYELNEANNSLAIPFEVLGPPPGDYDLFWVQSYFVPAEIGRNEFFNTNVIYQNQGTQITPPFNIGYYLSQDTNFDPAIDIRLDGKRKFGIGPAPNTTATTSFFPIRVPEWVNPGNYFLLIVLDENKELNESNPNNNVFASPLLVREVGMPDLVLKRLGSVPSRAAAGDSLSLSLNFSSEGTAEVRDFCQFRVYLSKDPYVSTDDPVLYDEPSLQNYIVHFGFSRDPVPVVIPTHTITGNYYLIGVLDAFNNISELSETNNEQAQGIFIDGIPGSDGVDLELALEVSENAPRQYGTFTANLILTNKGNQTARQVYVQFRRPGEVVYVGGNEYQASTGNFEPYGSEEWHVPFIQPGQILVLTVRYFRLQSYPFELYAQVQSQEDPDQDSSPGNGQCCQVWEDDEAVIHILSNPAQAIQNRNAIYQNLPTQITLLESLFPNPATDNITARIISKSDGEYRLSIHDLTGKLILEKELQLEEGPNDILLSIEQLPAGMYVVKLDPFHPYLRRLLFVKE